MDFELIERNGVIIYLYKNGLITCEGVKYSGYSINEVLEIVSKYKSNKF